MGITNVSLIVGFQKATLLQIVHFYETDSGRVVYTAHNRGVVARWQLSNDCRLGWIGWSVTAVLNIADLVLCDNTADYRCCQSSLEPINAPAPLCSSKVGLANALGILYGGAPSSGPMARIITFFAPVP